MNEHSSPTPIVDLINRLRVAFRHSDFVEAEKELISREEYLNKRISDLKEISEVLESELELKDRKLSELGKQYLKLARELSGSKEAEAEAKQRCTWLVEYSRLLEKQEEAVRAEFAAELRRLHRWLTEKEELLVRRYAEGVENHEAVVKTDFVEEKAELSSLQRRLSVKEEELEELRRRNREELKKQEDSARTRFEKEKAEFAAKLSSLQRRLAEKEKELEELRRRNGEELKKQEEAARTRFEEEKSEFGAKLSSLQRRLAEKEKELEQSRRQNTEELERRLAEKEEEFEELRRRDAEKLEKQTTLSSLQRRIGEKDLTQRNTRQLERKLLENEGKIRELLKKVEELVRKNRVDLEERYNEVIRVAEKKDGEIEKLEKEKEVLKLESSEVSARLCKIESFLMLDEDLVAALYLDVEKDMKFSRSNVREVLSGILNEFEPGEDGINTGNGMVKDVRNVRETGSVQPSKRRGDGVADGPTVQPAVPISNCSGSASDGGRGRGEGSLMQQAEPESKESGSLSDGGGQPDTLGCRHEAQKRKDWDDFLKFLGNHEPPLCPSSCGGAHVIKFLKSLNQFEKTGVHGCMYCGSIGPCSCPLEQNWRILDAFIGRLQAAYEENGGHWETNPFGARVVQSYLQEVRESQAKVHDTPYKKKRKRTSTYNRAAAVVTTAEAGGSHNFQNRRRNSY